MEKEVSVTSILQRSLIFIGITSIVFAQSDSAKYLWNAGDYRFGDNFFRCDVSDTIKIDNREYLLISAEDTSIIIPRKSNATFIYR